MRLYRVQDGVIFVQYRIWNNCSKVNTQEMVLKQLFLLSTVCHLGLGKAVWFLMQIKHYKFENLAPTSQREGSLFCAFFFFAFRFVTCKPRNLFHTGYTATYLFSGNGSTLVTGFSGIRNVISNFNHDTVFAFTTTTKGINCSPPVDVFPVLRRLWTTNHIVHKDLAFWDLIVKSEDSNKCLNLFFYQGLPIYRQSSRCQAWVEFSL